MNSRKMKNENLKSKILKLLASPKYQPLDKVELSKKLGLPSEARAELRELLREMEQRGEVARIRKERYVIPKTADLRTGLLEVHRSGSAHLISETKGEPDLFISAENTGTAMHGDRVVARILHEGVEEVRRRSRGEKTSAPTGGVIRILERKNNTIVGTLQQSKNFFYVIPDDSHLVHNIYVNPAAPTREHRPGADRRPREQGDRRATGGPAIPRVGDKVVVKFTAWETRHGNPEGEIIEVLGPASAPGVDMLSIIRKYNLPTEFPAAVQRDAERIEEKIHPVELERREDLRGQLIVTIDPDDAKDFDDAIHVEKHANGWSLGVHIADVSHYVTPGGALDREAYQRGNSVYLADRVIPMLPETLSNGICSLKPDVERLTRSAFIEFTKDGKIKSARFAHSVIRSAARLTYKQAFELLNNREIEHTTLRVPQAVIRERVQTAWELASILRKNRFAAGSLDLDFPEVKVWLDDKGRPVKLEKIENDISHQLIEEFMLSANEVVAHAIKNRKLPSLYRIHENPEPERLAEYRELATSYGCKAGDLTNRREVQRFLASIRGREEEYALKIGFLKSLKRATYDTRPVGHYGLAKVNYTHFTSPIRRYADLVVHRVLESLSPSKNAGSAHGRPRVSSVDLPSVGVHVSATERVATDAERESVRLKKMEFFLNQIRQKRLEEYHAVVVDVRNYGLLVELPDVLVTGMIPVSSIADDFYLFDSVRMQLVGRRNRKIFRIGDKLRVSIASADAYKQQMDFFIAG
jgi:ribonuclease R